MPGNYICGFLFQVVGGFVTLFVGCFAGGNVFLP